MATLCLPMLLGNAPEHRTSVQMGAIPPEVLESARAARNLPLAERMKLATDPLLDVDYLLDPMGEGGGRDLDPLTRYDAFDCLTLVEEAMALSLPGDPAHGAEVRNGLRYGNEEPDYGTRNHFMELQWIPEAVGSGWLRDVTAEYGETVRFENKITTGVWKAWPKRQLFQLTDEELPMGEMALDVLPIDAAIEAANRVKPGSIIMSVREHRSWVPVWITHTGFTIPSEGEAVMMRHASGMKSSLRVRDQKLKWYVGHTATYKHWKAAGIAIYEPVEFGPRLSILAEEGAL
jgi:hypothetical protein